MLYDTSALSVMKQFNTEQKTQIVKFYLKHGSAVLTQKQYRSHFMIEQKSEIFRLIPFIAKTRLLNVFSKVSLS